MRVKESSTQEQAALQTSWSACPDCSRKLESKPIGRKPPYTYCPFCGVQLVPIWWQRILITALTLILMFGFPASLDIGGINLLFAGLLCFIPALVLTMILVFKTIQPKYVRKPGAVMTLFHR